jgi:hypothetical protein
MALQINPNNVLYLTFRLLPIILPTYFVLSTLFSQDVKGIVYLLGLLGACFLTLMVGNLEEASIVGLMKGWQGDIIGRPDKCNLIVLSDSAPLSKIPLSTAVYSYTFWFIIYIIAAHNDFKRNNLWFQNIPTILFLGGILIADIWWLSTSACSSGSGIGVSFAIAGMVGALWAWILDKSGALKLQYFNGLSNRQYCERSSATTFKCSTGKRAGSMIHG